MYSSDLNLLYYSRLLSRRRGFIIGLAVLGLVGGGVRAMMSPRMYQARVTVLLPKGSQGTFSAMGIASFLGRATKSSGQDQIIAVMKSRRMRYDLSKHFEFDKKGFSFYGLQVLPMQGGLAVKVKGSDPRMTADIANFAVQHLDVLNEDFKLSTDKPMVRILDRAAAPSRPMPKGVRNKAVAGGMFGVIFGCLWVVAADYVRRLKYEEQQKFQDSTSRTVESPAPVELGDRR